MSQGLQDCFYRAVRADRIEAFARGLWGASTKRRSPRELLAFPRFAKGNGWSMKHLKN